MVSLDVGGHRRRRTGAGGMPAADVHGAIASYGALAEGLLFESERREGMKCAAAASPRGSTRCVVVAVAALRGRSGLRDCVRTCRVVALQRVCGRVAPLGMCEMRCLNPPPAPPPADSTKSCARSRRSTRGAGRARATCTRPRAWR